MTSSEINQLITCGYYSESCEKPELIETHISWVILCDQVVYKIKKPVKYPFLDFSTPELRKSYCEQEIVLNRRLAPDMYLGLSYITEMDQCFQIGANPQDELIDYAVRMKRMDRSREMDVLVHQGKVTFNEITTLAKKIALFHKSVQPEKPVAMHNFLRSEFNELTSHRHEIVHWLGTEVYNSLKKISTFSDIFLDEHQQHLQQRVEEGFIAELHGDLHTRNIFLLPDPVIFDCIEFNREYRVIDMLSEIAFLCMDLEALGSSLLSDHFFAEYNRYNTVIKGQRDFQLFSYYKCYRANIRAKVNLLRIKEAENQERQEHIRETLRYIKLMYSYLPE